MDDHDQIEYPPPLGWKGSYNGNVNELKHQHDGKLVNVAQGRELWSELHSTVTIETLPQWEEKIPNYSCKCKAFYNAWKIDNPPRKDDFFAWTVELHNAVNRKLEKLEMTLEEARNVWMV